jgi:hypothetical protein
MRARDVDHVEVPVLVVTSAETRPRGAFRDQTKVNIRERAGRRKHRLTERVAFTERLVGDGRSGPADTEKAA